MENLYKKTNYRKTEPLPVCEDALSEGSAISDSIYDSHRLITHGFISFVDPDGSVRTRLVGDVELAASSDPSILAVVSPEYQERLRTGLLNQQRQPSRGDHLTDDDLIDSVIPLGIEPDEAADYIRSVVSPVPDSSPNPSPSSIPTPSDESTPTE